MGSGYNDRREDSDRESDIKSGRKEKQNFFPATFIFQAAKAPL